MAAFVPESIAAQPDTAQPALECRMEVPARVRSGDAIPLRFELINRGKSRLRVLRWNTPLEGWFGRFLRVTFNGNEVKYQGPQFKRGAPVASDYVVVGAGRRVRTVADLTQVYAMTAPGHYEIAFDGLLHDVTANAPRANAQQPYTLACPPIAVEVAGKN